MKPLLKLTAFILESESSELPKKVEQAINEIGYQNEWLAGEYHHWQVKQPDMQNVHDDAINTYLLNNGVKLNSYVFIHY